MTSIFGMLGVDLTSPDHTTLSRRGQHLALALRRARPGTSLHLIVDSTGLSIVGEGEWAAVAAVLTPVEAIEGGAVRLAFDHERIVRDAVERTRSKLEYTALAARFCPPEFTITQLRRVYEAVWRTHLDPGDFQRNVQLSGAFEKRVDMPAAPPSGRGRRASLWSIRPSTSFNEPPAAPLARVPAKRRHREPGKGREPSAAPPSEPIVKSPPGEDDQT